jgi:hypothetical protein
MKLAGLDSLKISTTHFRIGFLVLNLVLTVLIGAQALFAVFQKPEFPKLTRWPDPEELKDTGGIKTSTEGLVAKAVQISRGLGDKPPPAPVLTGNDTTKKPIEDAPPGGPDDLPPGPLNDNWELSMCLVTGDPLKNYCVISKKDPASQAGGAPKSGPAGPKISSRVVRPQVRVPGAKTQRVPGQGAPSDSKMLRVKDPWFDEDLKINIWVVDIQMNRMVYEDATNWRQYALVKKTSSIYTTTKDGSTSLKKVEEPAPDPNNPDPKPEKHFFTDPIDRDSMFEKRKEAGAKAAAATPGPARPPGASRAPGPSNRPPSADELKKAGQAIGELKNNVNFKKELNKLSEKDRRMLETLGGAKK